MPRYVWTEQFVDVRLCAVVAESLEEAQAKREAGFWASEETLEFRSTGVATEMVEVKHAGGD